MPHGDFVWCDLSAKQLDEVCGFYGRLFGWQYHIDVAPDQGDYLTAFTAHETAGLYAMPAKFVDMGMPSFWMSYIAVVSVAKAVEIAGHQGGKVEVGPIAGPSGATIALIRDPLGAGFTVIEGEGLNARSTSPTNGDMAWNALYVSNADAVVPFYEALFGWSVGAMNATTQTRDVTLEGRHITTIHELPDEVRGKEQYWGVHFAVQDLQAARSVVEAAGEIIYEEPGMLLARDPDSAAFFLTRT